MGMDNNNNTPLSEESLRQFYSRTSEFWAKKVIVDFNEKKTSDVIIIIIIIIISIC